MIWWQAFEKKNNSILVGNLNSSRSYLIASVWTTLFLCVHMIHGYFLWLMVHERIPELFYQKKHFFRNWIYLANCLAMHIVIWQEKNMCLFLAIHLTIIYNIGRIKFEKKLESNKDIAHLILDKFHSIGIINGSELYKG